MTRCSTTVNVYSTIKSIIISLLLISKSCQEHPSSPLQSPCIRWAPLCTVQTISMYPNTFRDQWGNAEFDIECEIVQKSLSESVLLTNNSISNINNSHKWQKTSRESKRRQLSWILQWPIDDPWDRILVLPASHEECSALFAKVPPELYSKVVVSLKQCVQLQLKQRNWLYILKNLLQFHRIFWRVQSQNTIIDWYALANVDLSMSGLSLMPSKWE